MHTMIPRSLLVAALPAALSAQQIAEGIASQVVPLPTAASCPLALGVDDHVWFDGTDLWRATAAQPPQSLLHLPSFVFGSFTVPVGAGLLLFGETTNHRLWLVPLQGPATAQPLATAAFNYDAAAFDAQHAIVSAKTGGFGAATNDLLLVDLANGSVQPLASLPGASGPVAVAANGDIFYATASNAFPTPAGQTSVLRFPHAVVANAIQQGAVLTASDATVVFAGIDAAADICFDDDGDLLFTDWFQNTLGELNDVDGPAPWLSAPLVLYGSAPGAAAVQFVPGGAGTVFEPFQPAGAAVAVFETDYVSTSSLRLLTTARADLTPFAATPIPTGVVTVQVHGGPANGLGTLAIALDATPGTGTFAVAGFEQPLDWSLALLGTPILWPTVFDAQGNLSVTLYNPGFASPTAATAQVALLSAAAVLGSSTMRTLSLGQ